MADHKAARDRCEDFLKNQTEELHPEDLPVLEECPICFDTYEVEKPHRIKMDGCRHVIGRNCLKAILTNSPTLEKKCPLCRTKWMEAPAGTPASRLAARLNALAGSGPTVGNFSPGYSPVDYVRLPGHSQWPSPSLAPYAPRNIPRFQDLHPTSTGSQSQGQDRGNNGGRPGRSLRSTNRIINLVDSDDEEDPLQSFNSITRDINSVRERARNTQSTRKQRKENKNKSKNEPEPQQQHQLQPSYASHRRNAMLPPLNNVFEEEQESLRQQLEQGRHARRARQSQQDAPPSLPAGLWSFPGRRSQPLDLTQPNWESLNHPIDFPAGHDEVTQTVERPGDAMAIDEPNADAHNTDVYVPLEPREATRSPDAPAPAPRSPMIVCGNPPVRTSSLNAVQRRNAYLRPFVVSPSPESDVDTQAGLNPTQEELPSPTRTREEELNQREKELAERENRVTQRENAVQRREQTIADRERAVGDRVLRATLQEARSLQSRAMQLDEMEAMIGRHRREL